MSVAPVTMAINPVTMETAWALGNGQHDPLEACRSCGYALVVHAVSARENDTSPHGRPDPLGGCPASEVEAIARWEGIWWEV